MSSTDTNEAQREAEALPADDGSVRASVARLVASGRELADAELGWARLRAAVIAGRLRNGLLLGLLAAIFLVLAVIVLVAAAVIALAPVLGWLAASLVVGVTSALLAALLGLGARRAFSGLLED